MPTGRIVVTATPQGKRLDLVQNNPSPPPETISTWSCDPIPAWIWELAQGNAGETATVAVNGEGVPTAFAVGG
jgi:hypothetical protein